MPPKAKFSKEFIIETALKIVEEEGLEKLTARSLAQKLDASTKPIFGCFKNMDELVEETWKSARTEFQNYKPVFSDGGIEAAYSGRRYISFAQEKPNIFKFLFLQNQKSTENFEGLMKKIDVEYEGSITEIGKFYGFTREKSTSFYEHMWLYSHGIACFCAFNQSRFSNEEINKLMEEAGAAIIQQLSKE